MAVTYAEQHITLRRTLGASLALPKFQLGVMRRAWAQNMFSLLARLTQATKVNSQSLGSAMVSGLTDGRTNRVANIEQGSVGVREGELLWTPSAAQVEDTNLTRFAKWLVREGGLQFDSYDASWRWSVTELEEFWQAIWDYFGIQSSARHTRVLGKRTMPGAEWFPGARLNYAEHVLRNEQAGTDALMFMNESMPLAGMRWEILAGDVRILATGLRKLGVREVRRLLAHHGVKGFKFHPTCQGFFPNDRMAYPMYEIIAEHGLPAIFHSGHSGMGMGMPGGGLRLKYSDPMYLDDVAADFPNMKIIIAHPSWPWQDEALSVCLHKPNVFIDLSGWSPNTFRRSWCSTPTPW